MDQQDISRNALAHLQEERAAATDPTVIAGLDSQIRLHTELAGPEPEVEPKPRPAKTAKTDS